MKSKKTNRSKSKSNKSQIISSSKLIYEKGITPSNDNFKHLQNVFKSFLIFLNKFSIKQGVTLQIIEKQQLNGLNNKLFFFCVITKPFTNHPFIIYGFYGNNKYKIMAPLGNKGSQFSITNVKHKIKHMKTLDKLALLKMLDSILKIRESNIFIYTKKLINTPESLYNCANIKMCEKSLKEIYKMNISTSEKIIKSNKIYIEIKSIILENLNKYFNYLKENELLKAKEFLISYFSKIYIDTKPLLGHLLIFIEIYKLIDIIKKKV